MPGFGFAKYPQQPTPSSQAVGQALMQQGQQPQPPAPMMAPADPLGVAEQRTAATAIESHALRARGALQMTGPGQIASEPDVTDGHSTNALNIAVGEALTRMGSGYQTNPNPFKNRTGNMRQLQQLGLSATEAHLLAESGGV